MKLVGYMANEMEVKTTKTKFSFYFFYKYYHHIPTKFTFKFITFCCKNYKIVAKKWLRFILILKFKIYNVSHKNWTYNVREISEVIQNEHN